MGDLQIAGGQGLQSDGHAAGGGAGGAGQHVDSHGLGKENGAGHTEHGVFEQFKARHDLDHRAEAHGAGGVHDGAHGAVGAIIDGGNERFDLIQVHQATNDDAADHVGDITFTEDELTIAAAVLFPDVPPT